MEIIVLGAGQFGSALAGVLGAAGHRIFIIDKDHKWPVKNFKGPVILAVPTKSIPEAFESRRDNLLSSSVLISTAKGILGDSKLTPLEYLSKKIKKAPALLVLSGPSFATEISRGLPTALVLAGKSKTALSRSAELFVSTTIRIYKSSDPKGVELCGALKNVYAIAAGLCEGLGLGESALAALTTRSLAEMHRLGRALGAKEETFWGLAGVGDLFLTCRSPKSRNYRFGLGLASGKSSALLISEIGTVEGAWTAQVAQTLAKQKKIRTPILEALCLVMAGTLSPENMLAQLMARKLRSEFE